MQNTIVDGGLGMLQKYTYFKSLVYILSISVLIVFFNNCSQKSFESLKKVSLPSTQNQQDTNDGNSNSDSQTDDENLEDVVVVDGDTPPRLAFSDLISGPSTGLGDQKGSGVVVTIWGQLLGSSQAESTIEFCDATGVCRDAHVYYWKNADGKLPSGPANLYESHKMQEVAISIPESAAGLGRIEVTVRGQSASLPFTVRPGAIYHVKNNGDDSSGDGSWSNPWRTVAKADSTATAGDTLYIHNVTTTSDGDPGRVFYNNRGFKANTTNQFAYVSYPGTRAELYGKDGVHVYNTTGIVTSKLSVFASNCADESLEGCRERGTVGIAPSDWGRVIGNKITDRPGMCASGQAGAISGGINTVEGAKIFGNHIHDYGCPNTGKLHHTTYLTIRDNRNDKEIESWEMGWNYLKDNWAKNGLHFYDENVTSGTECGDLTTDMLVHDNVVVNQGGAGIFIASACGWTQDSYVYNNVLINVGLPVDVDCTFNCGDVGSAIVISDIGERGLRGNVYLNNNTVYGWDKDNLDNTLQSCIVLRGSGDNANVFINDNICHTDFDKPFITTFSFSESVNHTDNLFGANNIWYTSVASPTRALIPQWTQDPVRGDPKLSISGPSIIKVGEASSALMSRLSEHTHDIYGIKRNPRSTIGAVE